MTRIAEPQVSFADLEFCHQGVFLDPILEAISTLLNSLWIKWPFSTTADTAV